MNNLRKKIYKLRIKLLYLSNSIKYLSTRGKEVNIISSNKYKNKIKEDLVLQKYLLKEGYRCKIISFEDKYKDDSLNIIRSVWGYHHNVERFLKFINNNKTINNKDIIINNIDKKKQYQILKTNNIPIIDTVFLDNIKEYKYNGEKIVIKPVISASGDNTFIINNINDLENVKKLNNIMIQPFISSVTNGEISVIVIDKKVKYGIKRFPGVFTKYKKEEYININDLDNDIIATVNNIILIKEYKEALFMRIDFIFDNSSYKIMEVELVDPNLFIETISDTKLKDEVYKSFVKAIKTRQI